MTAPLLRHAGANEPGFANQGIRAQICDLDTENIAASYDAGVLTLKIPVAAKAKPRKITVSGSTGTEHQVIEQHDKQGSDREFANA